TAVTIAYWCVLAAAVLPYAFTLLAKSSQRFSNRRPREYLEGTDGWRKRAHWTQLNSFEAFPPFAAATIIAHLTAGPEAQPTINALALGFVGARVLYGAMYLADRPSLRSIAWFGGIACVVGLFFTAA